jgi:hypothetical protein
LEAITTLIRSVVAFFAAVVGFGLKHLIDLEPIKKEVLLNEDVLHNELVQHRWLCFAIVGLLAVRLLCGASAHLTKEYATNPLPPKSTGTNILLTLDMMFLLLFGLLVVHMAYASNIEAFITASFWLIGAAILWSVLTLTVRTGGGRWWFFLLLNVLLAMTFGGTYYLYKPGSELSALVLSLVASLLITGIDITLQLHTVR